MAGSNLKLPWFAPTFLQAERTDVGPGSVEEFLDMDWLGKARRAHFGGLGVHAVRVPRQGSVVANTKAALSVVRRSPCKPLKTLNGVPLLRFHRSPKDRPIYVYVIVTLADPSRRCPPLQFFTVGDTPVQSHVVKKRCTEDRKYARLTLTGLLTPVAGSAVYSCKIACRVGTDSHHWLRTRFCFQWV